MAAHADETFHEGECAVQERVGVREKLAAVGRHAIRDFMPDQHRAFFEQLPFLIAGTVDAGGQPWASVLANAPGFIIAPDPYRMEVHARPLLADPLHETLGVGAPIGLLGIEPQTRRRNRVNGIVAHVSNGGFSMRVSQSFGNCPKYIQAREPRLLETAGTAAKSVRRATVLDDAAQHLIRSADTFFIATAFAARGGGNNRAQGVDVSHRGGNSGFVRVDTDGTLTVPDFVGNFFFNTLGNLQVNPRAGLLFIDFASGDLLYVATDAEIIWEGGELRAFDGAQRLLRFRVRAVLYVSASLPLRWGSVQSSPFLKTTGAWPPRASQPCLAVRMRASSPPDLV